MSPPIAVEVNPDEKIRSQIKAFAMMVRCGDATTIGLALKFYGLLCAEAQGFLDHFRCKNEESRILAEVPTDRREDIERLFKYIEQELPRRRPVCIS